MITAERPYRPRLSIELTEDQSKRLNRLIPWGLKNALFQAIVDDLIELGEQHGQKFLAVVISRKLKAGEYLKGFKNGDD